jgi:hypothetical protein
MFGEQPTGEFGRVILFTGEQRGGKDGGPVCRFVLNSRSGALLDLGRIDCFAVEPHHHTQKAFLVTGADQPEEIRTDLAPGRGRLTLSEWQECARQGVAWLRDRWTDELRDSGWGEWVLAACEREKPALAAAVEDYLLGHPPAHLAG